MEMYRPVFDHDAVEKLLPKGEHILRVKVSLKLENYVEDAEQLLSESKGKVEIVALGRAMIRAISVAEILRRKGGGLHKEVKVYTLNVNTLYVPLEEGLRERNEAVHHNVIAIVLTKSPDDVDMSAPGYLPPLAPEAAIPFPPENIEKLERPRGRRGARDGTNGNAHGRGSATGSEKENGSGYRKGRGRRSRNRKRRSRKNDGNNKRNSNDNHLVSQDVPAVPLPFGATTTTENAPTPSTATEAKED